MEASGRVVVVTGGGSGIGAALCRAFAGAGAEAIIVADLDDASARQVAAEVGGTPVCADVAREAGVAGLVNDAVARWGRVDIYCSNAGVGVAGGEEASDDDWTRAWTVHVMAHVYAARALVPLWVARGEGYLVGTVSAAALLNHVGSAPYAATKAAALSFLEWLAIAHGPGGVRVSAVCPQGVRTPMLERAGGFLADGALHPDAVAAAVLEGMRSERFLILPHPEVQEYVARRTSDHARWLRGMQRLRASVLGNVRRDAL